MMNDPDEHLWVEKYRPQKIDDIILPERLKKKFKKMVADGDLLTMLFTGKPGVGKTTVAIALCKELGFDYLFINGSKDGNIDTLRGKVTRFASTVSLNSGPKVVILDEADYLNPTSTQPALRGFMEEFSKNCRFILTCNFGNRLIVPLHSRCSVHDFNITKSEMQVLAGQFMERLKGILEAEGIEYEDKQLAELIMKHLPDWRNVLNEAQALSLDGINDVTHSISSATNEDYDKLFKYLKAKDFKGMRKWVVEHMTLETTAIIRGIYDRVEAGIDPSSVPQLVLILADYQYKAAFVADHELNLVACLTEVMADVKFK